MNNITKYLEQLGFSEKEAKMYLTLLKSGPLTVAALAEAVTVNRTAAYNHIHSLLQKGVIAKVKGSANKVAANSPEYLHYLVEEKTLQIGILRDKLPSMISFLNTTYPQTKATHASEIKYYKGRNAVKAIYYEALKSTVIRSYFNPLESESTFPENFKLFDDAIANNPKIRIHEICEDTPITRWQIENTVSDPRYLWKILPGDVKLTSTDILIYDKKVAIINIRDKEHITGVVLENLDYYNSSVQLFDLLWRLLPDRDL